jgi:exodeoxyribonuclease VII small subunit
VEKKMAEQKFDEMLNRLERIALDLEAGHIDLDEAIKKYEEGIRLAAFCEKKLNEIKKKIEILVKEPSGAFSAEDFNIPAPEGVVMPRRPKVSGKKRRPRGEGLLF